MQPFSKQFYKKENGELIKMNFILMAAFLGAIVGAVVGFGLYFVRVSESRPIINCSSFTSKEGPDGVDQFVIAHPEYLKRLSRPGSAAGPCDSLPTSTPTFLNFL